MHGLTSPPTQFRLYGRRFLQVRRSNQQYQSTEGTPRLYDLVRSYVQIKEYTLCSEKNTHSHFLSYLHEWCVDLNKNCSEYTQGMVDSDHVEIRYSLWPMTSHLLNAVNRLINNNQLFNIRQQEYYCVIDELKCHKLCSKYPPFSLLWIRMGYPWHSVAVTLSRVSGDRT